MYCPNCGNEISENSLFCHSCGANLQAAPSSDVPVNLQEQNEHSFANVLRRALCSTKFLVMCILVSVVGVLSFAPTTVTYTDGVVTSASSSFDLFAILSTIAMWITYANAKKADPVMAVGGLKFNAIIAKITYVLNWILVVIILICGVLICAAGPMLNSLLGEEGFMEELYLEIGPVFESYGLGDVLGDITGEFISIFFIAFGVGLLIAGVAMLLLNIFYYGKVKSFANNLHISYITNKVTDLRFSTISIWFMVMGVLGAIGSISSLFTSLTMGITAVSSAVAMIVASLWVKELGEAVAYVPEPIEIQ